jgi:hypothetical protein
MDKTEAVSQSYTLAGWLAIISAILLIPEVGLAVILDFVKSDLEVIILPIHIANLIIGIFVLYTFRRLLNREFNFHNTDVIITVMILINVVSFVIGFIELGNSMFGLDLAVEQDLSLAIGVLLINSIVTIVFGVMLLKLKDDLFGLLQPYAYTTIVSGVCGATILLAPLGLLAAVIALVMLGMIFLRAKREAAIL